MDNINNPTMSCYKCDGEGITPSKAYVNYRNVGEEWQKEFNKKYPLKTCSMCNGEGTVYYIGGEKEHFNMLADRWEEETCVYSSLETGHPCFIEMDKMKSKEAIVWLLERMQKELTHLMVLLEMWVKKGDSPMTEDMRGKIQEITDAWIKWGIKRKFIKE